MADVEIILIDCESSDETPEIIGAFSESKICQVKSIRCLEAGLSYARNCGINAAAGEWLIFTDDDCTLADSFFHNFKRRNFSRFQYGSGQVLLGDNSDDPMTNSRKLGAEQVIKPHTILSAGDIQGANMFYRRGVFDKIGKFNERMGAGAKFGCDDIDMGGRASLSGFTGILTPDLIVYHHHGRKPGSPESARILDGYDYGRGAYYASMFLQFGNREIFDVWKKNTGAGSKKQLKRMEREFKGAYEYLADALR